MRNSVHLCVHPSIVEAPHATFGYGYSVYPAAAAAASHYEIRHRCGTPVDRPRTTFSTPHLVKVLGECALPSDGLWWQCEISSVHPSENEIFQVSLNFGVRNSIVRGHLRAQLQQNKVASIGNCYS